MRRVEDPGKILARGSHVVTAGMVLPEIGIASTAAFAKHFNPELLRPTLLDATLIMGAMLWTLGSSVVARNLESAARNFREENNDPYALIRNRRDLVLNGSLLAGGLVGLVGSSALAIFS